MKRLPLLLLLLAAMPLNAQNAASVKNDPSYIWAEASSGTTALDALISKLSALDMGVPPAMWTTYRPAMQSASTSEGGLRYMKRTDIPKLFDARRQKVRELLKYAASECSADVARTYLGWAETYLLSLPQSPELQRDATAIRAKLGDGPTAAVKMRNVQTEIKLIEKAAGKKSSGESPATKAAESGNAGSKQAPSARAAGASDPPAAAPAPRTESLEPVGATLRTDVDFSAPRTGLADSRADEPSAAAPVQKQFFIIPGVNIGNTVSYGLMAGARFNRLGAYAAAYSGLGRMRPEYSCRSDGSTDSGRIWTTGGTSRNQYSLTAGLLLGLTDNVCLSLGSGYGASVLYWQDTRDRWAEVTDLSVKGVRAELGCIASLGRLSLAAGVATDAFRTFNVTVGAGICF